jgi:hypothetical protein
LKKFIIICVSILLLYFIGDYLYYNKGIYISFSTDKTVTSFTKTEGKKIYVDHGIGKGFEEFQIKGVDMGVGIPGYFATDYAIDKATYLRWFTLIQEMGANTVRVYTILDDTFYDAVSEYNTGNENPLYIIHGLWVNDYVQNSRVDAYDESFLDQMIEDSRLLVDVIHGNRKLELGRGHGSGSYTKDISPWVIGYILGVEWEDLTVAYTDRMQKDKNIYIGNYFSTTVDASPFEAMLAQVGDKIIAYESDRYKQQRLVAFSNWATTDPFDYPDYISNYFYKIAKVDVEHIQPTRNFLSGTFASYHIYPYYPDYLNYMLDKEKYVDKAGKINTYYAYLKMINDHHTMPVVISEFGFPTSRGMAQKDFNTGRSQGRLSEQQQGQAIIDSYNDIMAAGSAGAVIFTWQDEWFKRTWNTMHAVDLTKTPYWSDYQTNEQYFGLLSFDPGKEKSISYVDGDLSEWKDTDKVIDTPTSSLSMKYDEKFIYFLAWNKGFTEDDTLYIPIDTTPKTGSNYSQNEDVKFERDADFLMVINGKENSRVLVQERYEVLRAMFRHEVEGKDAYYDPPDKKTPIFKNINLILQTALLDPKEATQPKNNAQTKALNMEIYETGRLTYGNANPESPDFNSLADFHFSGEYIEIKIPWQLFNFSNPSEMMIHDDYYENYGVENIKIDKLYTGIGKKGEINQRIAMKPFALDGWGRKVTYHERLKQSYYEIQKVWVKNE